MTKYGENIIIIVASLLEKFARSHIMLWILESNSNISDKIDSSGNKMFGLQKLALIISLEWHGPLKIGRADI